MAGDDELRAGDPCPIDGGEMVPDYQHDPDTAIANKNLNTPNPAAAQRYEAQTRAKVKASGVIHKCVRCGYQARFKTAEADQAERAADDTAREGREKLRDERDAKAREDRDAKTRDGAGGGGAAGGDSTASDRGAPGGGGSRRTSRTA
jgi:hypothetical protein